MTPKTRASTTPPVTELGKRELQLETFRSLRSEIESLNRAIRQWTLAWPVGFAFYWHWVLGTLVDKLPNYPQPLVIGIMISILPVGITLLIYLEVSNILRNIYLISLHLASIEDEFGMSTEGWEIQCANRRIERILQPNSKDPRKHTISQINKDHELKEAATAISVRREKVLTIWAYSIVASAVVSILIPIIFWSAWS